MSTALAAECLFYEFRHWPSSPSRIGPWRALAVSIWVSH